MTERPSAAKAPYAVPALEKAFEIIELLADAGEPMLVSEIAARLERSMGELFRIVVMMERHGYLLKSGTDDRYSVSYKLLDVAYRATPARNLVQVATPEMQALVHAAGQSCHLVVVRDDHGLILAREENPGVRGFALRQGASIDILRSCSGRVLLAFSPAAVAQRILQRADTGRAGDVASAGTWMAELRTRGFGMQDSPVVRGVTDISVPVFGFGHELMAALTIPFLELVDGSQRIDRAEACRLLVETAHRISGRLGDSA